MAKEAEDREDLLRDATAFVHRIEFLPPGQSPTFVGFREGGEPSFYFGQDHVLQFNSQGELRRAFWQGRMLASYQRTLHWLDRGEGRVRLTRTPLPDEARHAFESASVAALDALQRDIRDGRLPVRGEFPADGSVVERVAAWLDSQGAQLRFAVHPGLGRRKN